MIQTVLLHPLTKYYGNLPQTHPVKQTHTDNTADTKQKTEIRECEAAETLWAVADSCKKE